MTVPLKDRVIDALGAAVANGHFLNGSRPPARVIAEDMVDYCSDLEDEDPEEIARILIAEGLAKEVAQ